MDWLGSSILIVGHGIFIIINIINIGLVADVMFVCGL